MNSTSYQRLALRQVQAGELSRAPGIRRCRDCTAAFIAGNSRSPYCPDCRCAHVIACRLCGNRFHPGRDGGEVCPCCVEQTALFGDLRTLDAGKRGA